MKEVRVKVLPNKKKEGVRALSDGRYEISVREDREKGKANARAKELLAEYLHLPHSSVGVKRGHHLPTKTFCITE